jgi:trk system potassium uptake protein TrkH
MAPQTLLVVGFAWLIGLGAILLWLPLAHGDRPISLVEALFTAASAVCVTGLIVVDTGTAFSGFGQAVILVLIQVGGLGIMLLASTAFELLGSHPSLRAQAAVNDSLFQRDVATGFRGMLVRMLRIVLFAEVAGALVLFLALWGSQPVGEAAWSAVFHSISAFCNAGFSLYPDSLMRFSDSGWIVGPVMALIVIGGIGQPVLLDLLDVWRGRIGNSQQERRPRRLSLHTKVVLTASLALVVAGAVLLFLTGLTTGEADVPSRIVGAVFQSVTARTAGFNTVDIAALPLASLLILCVLMFIGGSPGSCAGGIKTSTAMIWLAGWTARIRGGKWPQLMGRHIPGEQARRAATLVGMAILWNVLGTVILSVTEVQTPGANLSDILFEQLSAFGTVGLSTGLTANLSVVGRLWIILTMFLGRVGPLTIVLWAVVRRSPGVKLPEGRVLIG